MKIRSCLSILLTLAIFGCASPNVPPAKPYVAVQAVKLPLALQLDVKPLKAEKNGCVPASLEMLFNYFGKRIPRDEITAAVQGEDGTVGTDIFVRYVSSQGFNVYVFYDRTPQKTTFKNFLHQGYPIMVVGELQYDDAHSLIVNGYTEYGTVPLWAICDAGSETQKHISYAEFHKFHNMNGAKESFFSMVIYPK